MNHIALDPIGLQVRNSVFLKIYEDLTKICLLLVVQFIKNTVAVSTAPIFKLTFSIGMVEFIVHTY